MLTARHTMPFPTAGVVSGRIVLNMWRLMRGELKLTSYSFESVVAAVLRLRVPAVPQHQMAAWFNGGHLGAFLCRLHPALLFLLKAFFCFRRGPSAAA